MLILALTKVTQLTTNGADNNHVHNVVPSFFIINGWVFNVILLVLESAILIKNSDVLDRILLQIRPQALLFLYLYGG